MAPLCGLPYSPWWAVAVLFRVLCREGVIARGSMKIECLFPILFVQSSVYRLPIGAESLVVLQNLKTWGSRHSLMAGAANYTELPTGSTKMKQYSSNTKNTEGFGPYLDLLKTWNIGILGQMRGFPHKSGGLGCDLSIGRHRSLPAIGKGQNGGGHFGQYWVVGCPQKCRPQRSLQIENT